MCGIKASATIVPVLNPHTSQAQGKKQVWIFINLGNMSGPCLMNHWEPLHLTKQGLCPGKTEDFWEDQASS